MTFEQAFEKLVEQCSIDAEIQLTISQVTDTAYDITDPASDHLANAERLLARPHSAYWEKSINIWGAAASAR